MLQGIQALMNQFSDIFRNNNEMTQHSILKDATSKLTGAWTEADNLTKGEKIKFLEHFWEWQSLASIYSSTKDNNLRRGYILHMLSPFRQKINELDKTLAR